MFTSRVCGVRQSTCSSESIKTAQANLYKAGIDYCGFLRADIQKRVFLIKLTASIILWVACHVCRLLSAFQIIVVMRNGISETMPFVLLL
jgi:hypothetical protein